MLNGPTANRPSAMYLWIQCPNAILFVTVCLLIVDISTRNHSQLQRDFDLHKLQCIQPNELYRLLNYEHFISRKNNAGEGEGTSIPRLFRILCFEVWSRENFAVHESSRHMHDASQRHNHWSGTTRGHWSGLH